MYRFVDGGGDFLAVGEYKLPPCAFSPLEFAKRNSEIVPTLSGRLPPPFMTETCPFSLTITSVASAGILTSGCST